MWPYLCSSQHCLVCIEIKIKVALLLWPVLCHASWLVYWVTRSSTGNGILSLFSTQQTRIRPLFFRSWLLLLDGGQLKDLAHAALDGLPEPQVPVLVPGQDADPGLDIVVQAELDVVGLGDFARGVGDLVFGPLVLDGEFATINLNKKTVRKKHSVVYNSTACAYRLGSMGLPAALFLSFLRVAGPRLARWSAEGLVMMVSQMTAWLVALLFPPVAPAAGHSAVT